MKTKEVLVIENGKDIIELLDLICKYTEYLGYSSDPSLSYKEIAEIIDKLREISSNLIGDD